MRYVIVIPAFVLLMTGCIGTPEHAPSPGSVQMRHSAYLGKSIMLFILDNGTPYLKKQLKNGKYLYMWNSRRSGSDTYLQRTKWNLEESDPMRAECEIEMHTSHEGKILSITAHNDISRNWDADRCADYLK